MCCLTFFVCVGWKLRRFFQRQIGMFREWSSVGTAGLNTKSLGPKHLLAEGKKKNYFQSSRFFAFSCLKWREKKKGIQQFLGGLAWGICFFFSSSIKMASRSVFFVQIWRLFLIQKCSSNNSEKFPFFKVEEKKSSLVQISRIKQNWHAVKPVFDHFFFNFFFRLRFLLMEEKNENIYVEENFWCVWRRKNDVVVEEKKRRLFNGKNKENLKNIN